MPIRSYHRLGGSGACSTRSAKSALLGTDTDASLAIGSMAGFEVFG